MRPSHAQTDVSTCNSCASDNLPSLRNSRTGGTVTRPCASKAPALRNPTVNAVSNSDWRTLVVGGTSVTNARATQVRKGHRSPSRPVHRAADTQRASIQDVQGHHRRAHVPRTRRDRPSAPLVLRPVREHAVRGPRKREREGGSRGHFWLGVSYKGASRPHHRKISISIASKGSARTTASPANVPSSTHRPCSRRMTSSVSDEGLTSQANGTPSRA